MVISSRFEFNLEYRVWALLAAHVRRKSENPIDGQFLLVRLVAPSPSLICLQEGDAIPRKTLFLHL